VALLIPLLALITPVSWLPVKETLGTWIQRSGSCMAVFGLLAEARAVNCFFILHPRGLPSESINEAIKIYDKHPKRLNLISFLVIAMGTLIWGYGDIPFK
jgi:hypothetical protein